MSSLNQKKILIQDLQNNFNNSKAVIFYNFHQVENRDIFRLKKELKKVGGYWKVYKNKLVEKAMPSYSLQLNQANAAIFCQDDAYKPLNILNKFSREHSSIKKRFHGGIYEQKIVDGMILEKWANLPSREVLVNTLCYYLNFQTQRFVNILEKIKSAKSNQ